MASKSSTTTDSPAPSLPSTPPTNPPRGRNPRFRSSVTLAFTEPRRDSANSTISASSRLSVASAPSSPTRSPADDFEDDEDEEPESFDLNDPRPDWQRPWRSPKADNTPKQSKPWNPTLDNSPRSGSGLWQTARSKVLPAARRTTAARRELTKEIEKLENELKQKNKEIASLNGELQQWKTFVDEKGGLKAQAVTTLFNGLNDLQKTVESHSSLRESVHSAKKRGRLLAKKMNALILQTEVMRKESTALTTTPPPTDSYAIVFSDIENSTSLWEAFPDTMATSLELHNILIRRLLQQHDGYEVKTVGDGFMASFSDPCKAIRWAVRLQSELLDLNWPDALLDSDHAKTVLADDDTKTLFSGLRVRVGLHWVHENSSAQLDPTTGRMDYFGPEINKAARVSDKACGGQIIISAAMRERLDKELDNLKSICTVFMLGNVKLKGIEASEPVHQVTPHALANRKFSGRVQPMSHSTPDFHKKRIDSLMRELHDVESSLQSTGEDIDCAKSDSLDLSDALQMWAVSHGKSEPNFEALLSRVRGLQGKCEKLVEENHEISSSHSELQNKVQMMGATIQSNISLRQDVERMRSLVDEEHKQFRNGLVQLLSTHSQNLHGQIDVVLGQSTN